MWPFDIKRKQEQIKKRKILLSTLIPLGCLILATTIVVPVVLTQCKGKKKENNWFAYKDLKINDKIEKVVFDGISITSGINFISANDGYSLIEVALLTMSIYVAHQEQPMNNDIIYDTSHQNYWSPSFFGEYGNWNLEMLTFVFNVLFIISYLNVDDNNGVLYNAHYYLQ